MKARNFLIVVGVVILLLILFRGCYSINITRQPTTRGLVVQTLEGLGILNAKVDVLAADVDTIKVDVRELKNRKCPTKTVWRTKTVVVPQAQPQPADDQITIPPVTPQPRRTQPQVGTITPGDTPGPKDLLFCIDLEPTKSTDSSKKFLFWELVNNLGYQISSVIPNNTGKSANMRLAPGSSVDGIFYDGEMLKMSVSSLGNWYAQIMGTPMPSDFRPAIRSNKSGWSSKIMIRSGDYFVYRF
ncbi:MAG TPA: hypothetical protein PKK28_00310 [bacterium]|nr:hypothetical protein [bacterium]